MNIKNGGRNKIILFIPFLALSSAIYFFGYLDKLESYAASFVTISMTVATFSVTFSFIQYQFSPYKGLLKSISTRQFGFSYGVIIVALVPLFVLFYRRQYLPIVSLFFIPGMLYAVLLLYIVAKEESDPESIMSKLIKEKYIDKFLKAYQKEVTILTDYLREFEFSRGDETPSHDFGDSKYLYTVQDDPFSGILNVTEIALGNTDIPVYEQSVDLFISLIDRCVAHKNALTGDFLYKVQAHINVSFERLAYSTFSLTDNKTVQNKFIEKIGTYSKSQALLFKQTMQPCYGILSILSEFGSEILRKGNATGALLIISLHRQLAQKGVYDNPKEKAHMMFDAFLPFFPRQIMVIGQTAIKLKDSDFLFRCLEELGYLGCTAIKNDHYNVGIECLQSLVQLGREARAIELKCFWRHCQLEPVDHAEQRITWMLTWVTKLPEESQTQWIESFQVAYSRLLGVKTKIDKIERNGKKGFTRIDSETPYVESYSEEHFLRKVDYSDIKEVKEFKIY